MIISHTHKFIFIKTRKTAGTSIEIALSRYCGPRDVITQITPEDERLRQKAGNRGPQNTALPTIPLPTFCELVRHTRIGWAARNWIRDYAAGATLHLYNHVSANIVRRLLPRNIWNNYFKFCFERNPWDKVISYYFWCYRSEQRPSLSDFIRSGRGGEVSDFDLYSNNGQLLVDFVGSYERLEDDWKEVCTRIGLREAPTLEFAKSGYRTDRRSYTELLSPEDRDAIAHTFAREIAYFDYAFSTPSNKSTAGRSATEVTVRHER